MSDDIDDVMGFNEEPEYNESSIEEPIIPEIDSVVKDQHEVEPTQQNDFNNSDYDRYENWEESDGSGIDLIQSQLSDNENNSSERISSLDNNTQNEELEEYDERSQSQKILDAEPSIKEPKTKKTNKGTFFNRSKILTLLAFIFVVFILFFSIVFPMLTEKKQKKEAEALNKNGKTYIPSELQEEIPPSSQNNHNEKKTDFTDSNSAMQQQEQDYSDKYPSPVTNKNTAPVSVPASTSSSSDFPITNRNEQQKSIQRLSLDNSASPTAAQKSKYPEKELPGYNSYNTGYNSGYSGSSTSPSYTPRNLDDNINKILSQQQGMGASNYERQNNQTQKEEFIKKNGLGGQFQWNEDYSLWKGTIITVVLDTGINTDLPGQVLGHVTKNIYSSQDGKYLLIPQGSRLFGEYSSQISYGQARVQVVWNTLIRPDGLEINLGSMNGIDAYGRSGYKGFKTEHPFEYAKAFGLIAAYSILDTKAMNLIDSQNNMYAQNVMTDVYSESKKLNNEIVERAMDIQPTIKISSGTEVNLITNVTIDLPPLEPYEVDGKYIRN